VLRGEGSETGESAERRKEGRGEEKRTLQCSDQRGQLEHPQISLAGRRMKGGMRPVYIF